jgi:renalase
LGIPTAQVGIVGAGIAGMAARRSLEKKGFSTLLFEKSRGAGGRMATRRMEYQVFDLGAQFTSAADSNWAALLKLSEGELTSVDLPGESVHARYTHQRGMSALARTFLSANTSNIQFSQRITAISNLQERFEIATEAGPCAHTDWVLLTAPVPQSLALLQKSFLEAPSLKLNQLQSVRYDPCLTVIATLSRESGLPKPGILRKPTPKLAGIFDQGSKGVATAKPTLVVHASAELSVALWNLPDAEIAEQIWVEAARHLGALFLPIPEAKLTLHRWKYCQPSNPLAELHFSLGRIIFAGDAFGQCSVNGAFASGEAAAEFIAQQGLEEAHED